MIRDAGRRTQSTCGGGGGLHLIYGAQIDIHHFLLVTFFSFSNKQEANQINIHFETLNNLPFSVSLVPKFNEENFSQPASH